MLDVAYSRDGTVAAAGAADGTVRLWNPHAGSSDSSIVRVGGAPVDAVAVDQSGTVLVTGSADGRVRFWTPRSKSWHEQQLGLRLARPVTSIAFSSDGTRLAVSSGNLVRVLEAGRLVRTIKGPRPITSVAFAAGDETLVTADAKGGAVVWDVSSKVPRQLAGHAPEIPSQTPRRIAYDPNSGLIAIAGTDGEVRLWGYELQPPVFDVLSGHVGPVNDVAFSPDGSTLASAGADSTVRLWDVQSREEIRVLGGHRAAVERVVFSSDGNTLLTASKDGTAREWRASGDSASAHAPLNPYLGFGPLAGVAFSAGGLLVAAGGSGDVHGWSLAKPDDPEVWTCSNIRCDVRAGSVTGVAAGGKNVVIAAKPSRLYRPPVRHAVLELPAARAAALSPDGRELALATRSEQVELRGGRTGSVQRMLAVPTDVRPAALAFSRDGQSLAAVADAGRVIVWARSRDWRPRVLGGAGGALRTVTFTPDGRAVVAGGGADGDVWLWNMSGGQPATFAGHSAPVTAVAVSPDGKILASASEDFTARLWDIDTRATIRVLTGPQSIVTGIAFSPSGSVVATTAEDGKVRLWDGCLYCLSPPLLLARARHAAVRCLTALERRVYLHEHVTKDESCAA